jgi:hypothetical protein
MLYVTTIASGDCVNIAEFVLLPSLLLLSLLRDLMLFTAAAGHAFASSIRCGADETWDDRALGDAAIRGDLRRKLISDGNMFGQE